MHVITDSHATKHKSSPNGFQNYISKYRRIDCEHYSEQPKGYEKIGTKGEKFVCTLDKSLNGLKQSGRIWNLPLHDNLIEQDFKQCLTDIPAGTRLEMLLI